MRGIVFALTIGWAGIPVMAMADGQVADFSESPQAKWQPVPVEAVRLGDGFWTQRRRVNVEVSLPTLYELFEEKGIIDNFRRVSGRKQVARRGPLFTDSDVYKWLEAVAFVLMQEPESRMRPIATQVIEEIAAAQEPSGYLNTYYTKENLAQRHQNMRHGHELYCLGHLIQAGIAWKRATGETRLLDTGRKMADYLVREFGPGKKPIIEGHPEIEMALVELYRETGVRSYLDFAGYLLEGDSRVTIPPRDVAYLFTAKPFRERMQLEGHAVRAMYACAGATDYLLETGEQSYVPVLQRLWSDLANRKSYITGGIGSRASGETFGEPYELPNQLAYTESCAAIGTIFWNWRMAAWTGEAKYMDAFERALYNGANSGLSLGGNLYCYRNPLELVGNPQDRIRNPWYDTTCCPPNLQRLLASLPGYFYSASPAGLTVHLYHANRLKWKLPQGTPIEVSMQTNYPWSGKVEMAVAPAAPVLFALKLRIPAWSSKTAVRINGQTWTRATQPGSYLAIEREWRPGDRLELELGTAPRLTAANPRLRENAGKVAVEMGPLVYCMENPDQLNGSSVFDWWLKASGTFISEWRPDLLGGIILLRHPAWRLPGNAESDPLYRPYTPLNPARMESGEVRLIPYYTFANREPAAMQVWIPLLDR